jgi:hypothetical protein
MGLIEFTLYPPEGTPYWPDPFVFVIGQPITVATEHPDYPTVTGVLHGAEPIENGDAMRIELDVDNFEMFQQLTTPSENWRLPDDRR